MWTKQIQVGKQHPSPKNPVTTLFQNNTTSENIYKYPYEFILSYKPNGQTVYFFQCKNTISFLSPGKNDSV